MCRFALAALILAAAGCMGTIDGASTGPASTGGGADAGVGRPDAGPAPQPDAQTQTPPPGGIAPAGAVAGEVKLADGATAVTIGDLQTIYRVDAAAGEHVAFGLAFSGG